jgi:TolB-like protein/Tfp pilus assembly protein PilF
MSIFRELKRRNVFRVAAAYAVVAWLLIEVTATVFPILKLPDWSVTLVTALLLIGFPVALILAWAFEITPEGIMREKDVDRNQSITHKTRRNIDYIIIAALILVLGFFAFDKFVLDPSRDAKLVQLTTEAITEQVAESSIARNSDKSIAVLPFVNMSSDPEQEYFSDGISEELLNVLVQVDDLRVASRTSSFAFKGENKNLVEIADVLNVSYVLEGSVRKAGNRVRITAQLIEAASDQHLWSDIYDRELTDIFAVQEEIANAIVSALGESLGLEGVSEISVLAATTDMNAYDSYLQGRELFIVRTDLKRSVALFEQAVALDPRFARAWEGLAAVYAIVPSWGIIDRDYHDLAIEAARTALAIDDGLSLAYSVIGSVLRERQPYLWQDSFENYKLAAANGNKNATNFLWRAITYMHLGFFELAMADLDHCLRIDPQYGNCHMHKAVVYLLRGERDKGIALFLHTLESGVTGGQTSFISALVLDGNRVAALLLADKYTGFTGAPIKAWVDLIENREIDRQAALEAFDRWVERQNIDTNQIEAMSIAFGAYDRITHGIYDIYTIWLPEFAEFRQSPHFNRVVNEFNMQTYWRSSGFPPQCRSIGDTDFECE